MKISNNLKKKKNVILNINIFYHHHHKATRLIIPVGDNPFTIYDGEYSSTVSIVINANDVISLQLPSFFLCLFIQIVLCFA